MIKDFYLGLLAAIVCALAALTYGLPLNNNNYYSSNNNRIFYRKIIVNGSTSTGLLNQQDQQQEQQFTDDGSVRSERSTNLSHITGSARKIRMYVKNRHLQILPDGTVNGTSNDNSDYTVLQRTTVNIGQLKIQGVATCQYLCMDSCGLLYGSKEFLDECVFNEMIEQSHYNTYSSARYSNTKRTMYLALNKRGQSKKVQIKAQQQLGKLSLYTRVLTQPVSAEKVEDLINRLLAENGNTSHPLRHHGSGNHLCSSSNTSSMLHAQDHHSTTKHTSGVFSTDSPGVDRLRCRKRKKRKKKRRRYPDDEEDKQPLNKKNKPTTKKNNKKCEHINKNDECQRVGTNININNNHNNNNNTSSNNKLVTLKNNNNKDKNNNKNNNPNNHNNNSSNNKKLGTTQLESVRNKNNKKGTKKPKVIKNKNKKTTPSTISQNITETINTPVLDQGKEEIDSRQVEPTSMDASSSASLPASNEDLTSWEQTAVSTSAMDAAETNDNPFLLQTSSPRTI